MPDVYKRQESPLDAARVLMRLDLGRDLGKRRKTIKRLDIPDGGEIRRKVFVQKRFVINNAVGLENIGNARDLVAVRERKILVRELCIDSAVRQVIAIVLPVLQPDRAVDLEQRRRIVLDDLRGQRVLIGAGRRRHHRHRNARFLRITLSERFPRRLLFGLEIEIVDTARRVAFAAARRHA